MVVRALFWLLQYVSWQFEPSDALQTGNLPCWKLSSKNRPSINHIRYMCTNQHNNYEVETEIYSETATAIFKEQGLILVSPEGRDCGWCQTGFPRVFGRHSPIRGHAKRGRLFLSIGIFLAVVADANLLFIKRHSGAKRLGLRRGNSLRKPNAQR